MVTTFGRSGIPGIAARGELLSVAIGEGGAAVVDAGAVSLCAKALLGAVVKTTLTTRESQQGGSPI